MVVSCLDFTRVELIVHSLNGMAELVVVEHYHVKNESSNEAIYLAEVRGIVPDLVVLRTSGDIQNEVNGSQNLT